MKTTKIIATLGVAAALGVSCIPMLGVHAADNSSSSAKVTLTVGSQGEFEWDNGSALGDIAHSLNPGEFGVSEDTHTITIVDSNNKTIGWDLKVYGDATNGGTAKSSLHSTLGDDIPAATGKLTAGTAGWGLQAAASEPDESSTSWLAPGNDLGGATKVKGEMGKTTNDSVTIYYGFATAATTKSGDYSAKINYVFLPHA